MIDVPHEVIEKLQIFQDLVQKWNKAINLISENSTQNFWKRHILDSLQLIQYINDKEIHLVDIGSGAGFPGIILSIAGVASTSLIEADLRKCIFLEKAAKISNNNIQIINQRIEKTEISCNILTCRAFSNLNTIFDCTKNISVQNKFLLPKGKSYLSEIKEARKKWLFKCLINQSITSKESKILEISDLTKII
ncbi:16S rRNA (guanine(527)-N(7))-methyltransferase RsmG [Rickettsia bellii]|uniref:Ribosomal RNA small subunit methyltransferase G n=2 Tax=Rickettsia bellii TaxID=33990 RepID=RSMG_RICBR|nr:16S rRNA (guanine(527)-N(7))-methyltransferase RsmG [Rickettsia bellii]A8GUR2.1 RecName: Full=Ribosomal RNA small subunit methyltransferase G; AltName: Full=16S rRNA 7-methylguanosine methyltransferase; Short=16S rRNA m7G methyltransferase [Rickettsia bellii OSU 85-389]Q1RGT2.1 RecName: Full=Ribosomal RNA small subunit methyltransferase G; AltName: Full=16S rRNA 7-methylguanosine methyltransferase; Short=16S rRNA m7G methyltransferase [Rickettsia bellii RML369-C]ABE05432.1 Putative S-adenosyl